MTKRYKNANEAYEAVLDEILQHGIDFGDTKAIFNCGFYIDNPSDKYITNLERNWSKNYASAEWYWYLSGDPSVDKLSELYGRVPPIWNRMADNRGEVNSNYGYQWQRSDQLGYVVNKLRENPDTRHLINSHVLEKANGVHLVNTSRSSVVDHYALHKALIKGNLFFNKEQEFKAKKSSDLVIDKKEA